MHHNDSRGIVLALGGGGAAGLAHIGVLQVLAEEQIPVRAVVGTSIGAEIGAFLASGMAIDDLAVIATKFDWKQTLQLFFPDLPDGGLISGVRIVDFLHSWIGKQKIEDLQTGYVAIATDLMTGEQVELDHGDLVKAVRASISIPGVMAPFWHEDRWLVDGGVVNPLPFDVARRRFGGPVLAVAVHGDMRNRSASSTVEPESSPQWAKQVRQLLKQPWMERAPVLREWLESQTQRAERSGSTSSQEWTTRRVLDRAINITEAEIIRLRASINPPDLVLTPDIREIGLLEFYHAEQAIAAGREAARQHLRALRRLPGRRLRRKKPA